MSRFFLIASFVLLHLTSFAQEKYMYGSNSEAAVQSFLSGWHHIMDLGEWTLAEEYFRKAVEQDPDFTIGKTLVGRISRDLKERKELLADLEDEREGLSEAEVYLYDLFIESIRVMNDREVGIKTNEMQRGERLDKKLSLFRSFLNLHPEESYIKAEYIETITKKEGARIAIDSLEKLSLPKDLELGFYKTYLSGLLCEIDSFDRALDILENFSSSFPDVAKPPALFNSYGNYFWAREQLDSAYIQYKQTVDLDSNHLIALSSFNRIKAEMGILVDEDELRITKLTDNTYIHSSYLESENYGRVGCNGLVVVNDGEAAVFDTPASEEASEILVNFLQGDLKVKVRQVIPTHHHEDCLAGLKVFHENNISSLALDKTKQLADEDGREMPMQTFSSDTTFDLGGEKVVLIYPGAGHTSDNIIAYFPRDSVLFGGCFIKSVGASEGNLSDANLATWSNSVEKARLFLLNLKHVVPGHGSPGGQELIDYTANLFRHDPILIKENGVIIDYKNHPGRDSKVSFSTVARADLGYSYEIVKYSNSLASIRISKNDEVEFEFLASTREAKMNLNIIDQRRDEWIKLCNENNASALVEEMYSVDALYYNHKPIVRGRKAITADYQYMNNPNYNLYLSPLEVHAVSNNIVFEIGQCSASYGGKYIIIWRKDADNVWRVFLDSNI